MKKNTVQKIKKQTNCIFFIKNKEIIFSKLMQKHFNLIPRVLQKGNEFNMTTKDLVKTLRVALLKEM